MHYRVILPTAIEPNQQLSVVYLLHGAGEDYRSWSNYSGVAHYAERGLALVMPQGDYSYYVNAVDPPSDRYEDYITHDLIADVEAKFPIARGRANRAIVGVSMGGFGAINLALHHPELYSFAGALSPAIDVPRREFSIRRLQQSMAFRSLFGAHDARHYNDPFTTAQRANPAEAPYFFLTVGDRESLLTPNREFATLLSKKGFPHEFHVMPGDHQWQQWNSQIPGLFQTLLQHLGSRP